MCEARWWWWLGRGEGGRHKSTQKGVGLRRRRRRRSVRPWINKRWDRPCTCSTPTWATKSRCAFTSSTIAAEVIYANAFYLQSQWLIQRDATLDKMNGHRGRRRARGRRDERGGGAAVADKEKEEEKKTLLLMTLSGGKKPTNTLNKKSCQAKKTDRTGRSETNCSSTNKSFCS